ncbi:MotA/TolQ/ExbB proton channel family protein [Rubinisphaera brasiliensis]|uniref:MotA/TolQ/ExbB proton channel n=1 Tax=Rubinisphaera brasiliensis (strain ATCC 49424 / DSM 5305 / JCM 21570 / IAM 15109 / NBRC 103401 / IFAM 1448) TaxID=756272 RepID=F0SHE3_RUBBR|nr:MotA/TolQ/ExbB proton channel family protein [Rubinisphaera brasiliensis]ADY61698.1 MotA/TolQ/ExbB proton channel [Rubinisphaera brasiliensis DSM 5305]
MNMDGLESLVYETSLLLLYPVLGLLGLCFLRVVWQAGELVHDTWLMHRHRRDKPTRQLRLIQKDKSGILCPALKEIAANRDQHPLVRLFATNVQDALAVDLPETLRPRIDHLIAEYEAKLARDVNHVRILIRLGPCLGLAGTLIPLGPGLTALSNGDLSELSSRLVVAFSTTVVGLLIGGVSYVLALARAHAADRLAGDLELIGDSVCLLTDSDAKASIVESSHNKDYDKVLEA